MKNNLASLKQKLFNIFLVIVFVIAIVPVYVTPVNAGLTEDLVAVQKRLQEIRNQKAAIQNNINNQKVISNQYDAEIDKLKLQIDLLDAQVLEKGLVIQELDLQINLLTQNIKITEEEISKAESNITTLEEETDQRMVDLYINEKTDSQLNVFLSAESTDFIKYSVYQQSVQQETNDMVAELNVKKQELLLKKTDLENSRLQIVANQTQLNAEKLALVTTQSEYDQKRALFTQKRNAALSMVNQYSTYYKNMSAEEKRAEEQQEAIMRVIMASTEAGNGVFVKAGTFIGIEGTTGNSTGVHLDFRVFVNGSYRNPCDYLPYNIYPGNGDDNCDHKGSGQLIAPLSPAGRLTSGYTPWYRPGHYAIDISSGTGHGNVIATHDGYVYYYDNQGSGWGIHAKVCSTRNCSTGLTTGYNHLACTAEPKGTSARSCNK